MSERTGVGSSAKYLLVILVTLTVLINLGCSAQQTSSEESVGQAIDELNSELGITAPEASQGSVPEQPGGWALIPIGYGKQDQLGSRTADPGWSYLWVFFALHNGSANFEPTLISFGDMSISTAEGYTYSGEGVIHPQESVRSMLLPPGINVIGSSKSGDGEFYPYAALFKVATNSSGYSIQSTNFGLIPLSDISELTFSYSDIDFTWRDGSANLQRVLQQAAENQGVQFLNQMSPISSFGDRIQVGQDAGIEVISATREEESYTGTDRLLVELIHHNSNGGYGKQFSTNYYLLTDEGLVIVMEDNTGLKDEVGPGQSGPVSLEFHINENVQGIWLVASGEANAIFNLGNPESETADFWRENDINQLIELANRSQPALIEALDANDPNSLGDIFTDNVTIDAQGHIVNVMGLFDCEATGSYDDQNAFLWDVSTTGRADILGEDFKVYDDNHVAIALTQTFDRRMHYWCIDDNTEPSIDDTLSGEMQGEEIFVYLFTNSDEGWRISHIAEGSYLPDQFVTP